MFQNTDDPNFIEVTYRADNQSLRFAVCRLVFDSKKANLSIDASNCKKAKINYFDRSWDYGRSIFWSDSLNPYRRALMFMTFNNRYIRLMYCFFDRSSKGGVKMDDFELYSCEESEAYISYYLA